MPGAPRVTLRSPQAFRNRGIRLPPGVTPQGFQPIASRGHQILETAGSVQHIELPQRHRRDIGWQRADVHGFYGYRVNMLAGRLTPALSRGGRATATAADWYPLKTRPLAAAARS